MPKKVKAVEVETITLDTVAVMKFEVQTLPIDKQFVVITPAKGYEDADGNFIPNKPMPQVVIQGDELVKFMGTKLEDIVAANPDATIESALTEMLHSKI